MYYVSGHLKWFYEIDMNWKWSSETICTEGKALRSEIHFLQNNFIQSITGIEHKQNWLIN